MTKILFIENTDKSHNEVVESVIQKYNKIIKESNCKLFLKVKTNNSFIDYIKKKYPYITFGKPNIYHYYIQITLYPKHYNSIKNKNKNKNKNFYISHRVNSKIYKNAKNIFYLTPLSKYNVFYADILPFSNEIKKTNIPIYVIQGNITSDRRNYNLLIKILSNKYNYDFKIKFIGRGSLPEKLKKYKKKIILKNNLNFQNYHKEFLDCYCILPLITKKTHPQYYSIKLTSTINYARGYKLKCLIDKNLQDIYKLKNVEIFNNENNIINAFKKTLEDFYK